MFFSYEQNKIEGGMSSSMSNGYRLQNIIFNVKEFLESAKKKVCYSGCELLEGFLCNPNHIHVEKVGHTSEFLFGIY